MQTLQSITMAPRYGCSLIFNHTLRYFGFSTEKLYNLHCCRSRFRVVSSEALPSAVSAQIASPLFDRGIAHQFTSLPISLAKYLCMFTQRLSSFKPHTYPITPVNISDRPDQNPPTTVLSCLSFCNWVEVE